MIGSHHIDTLILGCTELPILFEMMNISVPVVDVTDVHVEALIKAVKNNRGIVNVTYFTPYLCNFCSGTGM